MPTVIDIDPQTAKTMLDTGDAIMIDVREQNEYDAVRIDGVPLQCLSTFSPEEVPEHAGKKLIFQCKVGGRSMMAGQQMIASGYNRDVYNMMGGIEKWKELGFPVVRQTP